MDPITGISSAIGGITSMIGALAGGQPSRIEPQIIEKPVNVYVPVREKLSPTYGITFAGVGFAIGLIVGSMLNSR